MEVVEEIPSILVPIQHTDQFVEVFVDELPDDEKDLCDLLRAEIAPLDIWHRFAVEYYRQGRKDAFREILKEAKNGFDFFEQKRLVGKEKVEFNEARLKIINGLAADLIFDLIEIRPNKEHATVRTEILTYFTTADRINPEYHLTWVCKSMYEMINGQTEFVDRAENWIKPTLKEDPSNIPALLVKGFVHFERAEKMDNKILKRKEYENSLRCYETVLRSKPDCDPTVRLGIALCCSRLGQVEHARFAFQRVLALDPQSVDAAVGLSLLDMAAIPRYSTDHHLAMQQATEPLVKLRESVEGENSSSMLLNHTANRAFFTFEELGCTAKATKGSTEVLVTFNGGVEEVLPDNMVPVRVGDFQTEVVSSTAEGGAGKHVLALSQPWPHEDADELAVSAPNFKQVETDAGSAYWYSRNQDIKAEAYYFLGRNDHVCKRYKNAEKYYKGAVHLCSSFAPAQVGLARILIREHRYNDAIVALEAAIAEFPDSCEALLLLGKLHERRAGDYKDGREEAKAKHHSARALKYYIKASEADPTNPDVWLARALALQRSPARNVEALEAYHKGVDLLRAQDRSVDVTVLTNMGALQHACGQLNKAIASYHQALEVDHADLASGDAVRHTLYVMEPANAPFWKWEVLDGTVSVEAGSNVVSSSEDLTSHIHAHDQLLLVPSEEGEPSLRVDVTEDEMTANNIVLKQRMFHTFSNYKVSRKVSRLPVRPSNVTTCFNLACLHEAMGEWHSAIELYKAISIKFPKYHDATLRLAKVYDVLGMTNKSLSYLDRIQKASPKDPSPAAMSGSLLLRSYQSSKKTKRLDHAKQAFESIQKMDEKYKKDAYAMTSIANIYFTNLHRTAPATGVANVLAEEGHMNEAQDILGRLKMAAGSADIPDATLNYGHLLTMGGKYLEAIKNYDSLLKKSPHFGKDPELLVSIANALFCDSRHKEAMRSLSRALRSNPSDAALWHNCGVLQYAFAQELFDKHKRPGVDAVVDITSAGEYAVSAKRIFSVLLRELEQHETSATDWGNRLKAISMDCDKMSELITYCDKAISQVPDRVRVAQEVNAQYELNRQERTAKSEAAAKAKADEVSAANLVKEEAVARAAERARQKQEMLVSLSNTFQAQPEKKSKKKRKADENDASNYDVAGEGYVSSDNENTVVNAPKRLKNQTDSVEKSTPALGLSDSEEDEFNTETKTKTAKKSAASLGLSDSEEDEFNTETKTKTAKKSAASLGLSDSEEEEETETKTAKKSKPALGLSDSEEEDELNTETNATPVAASGLGDTV